jgi:hypothetical protein
MDDVIDMLRERNEPVPVPLELPDEDLLVEIEEQLYVALPDDLRAFLLTVSDVVCGRLEPVTVTDPNSHTFLPEVAAVAWSLGLAPALPADLRVQRRLLLHQSGRHRAVLGRTHHQRELGFHLALGPRSLAGRLSQVLASVSRLNQPPHGTSSSSGAPCPLRGVRRVTLSQSSAMPEMALKRETR